MPRWFKFGKPSEEGIEKRIQESERAAELVKMAAEIEASKTEELKKEALWMARRGKTNRYGESLMLAMEMKKKQLGHG